MVQGYLGQPLAGAGQCASPRRDGVRLRRPDWRVGRIDILRLDARNGELRREKRFENRPSPDAAGPDLPLLPSATGQMAWYDGRLWLKSGMYYGPIICDPASGDMKSPVDMARAARDMIPRWSDPEQFAQAAWNAMPGQDIGIMPDGWVALGGPQFFLPLKQRSQPHRSSGFLRPIRARPATTPRGSLNASRCRRTT